MPSEIYPGATVDPDVVHGKPVIAGTRAPVSVVVGELAGGSSFEDIHYDYHLADEQIRAALGCATSILERHSAFYR